MTEAVSKNNDAVDGRSLWERLGVYIALPIWMFGLVAGALWPTFTLLLFFISPKLATVSLAFLIIAFVTPLSVPCPAPLSRFLAYCTNAAAAYYPVSFHYEDKEEVEATPGPVIIGYEPHSVMPQAISMFSEYPHSEVVKPLAHARTLASSAGFWNPGMRHLWWWLGTRPVSKASFLSQLRKGRTVALCPGGVQECLYMKGGVEVVYLRKRFGFVKLAIQTGTPLVPVFAFGQTETYSYVRPFIDWESRIIPKSKYFSFVRKMGYVPMLIFGHLGTAMPKRVPIDIVIGRPIKVPKQDNPDDATVKEYLDKFIDAMQNMFESRKAEFGYPNLRLEIH